MFKKKTLDVASRIASLVEDIELEGDESYEDSCNSVNSSDEEACEAIDPAENHLIFEL